PRLAAKGDPQHERRGDERDGARSDCGRRQRARADRLSFTLVGPAHVERGADQPRFRGAARRPRRTPRAGPSPAAVHAPRFRLGRSAVEAARRGYREDGCTAAALLNERDARGDSTLAPTGSSDVLDLLERRRSPRAGQARAQLLRLAPPDGPRSGTRDEAILISVLAGFPDRVAKRRGADLLLASGGAAQLSTESAVRDAGLLVAVEAEERRTGNRARV